MFLGVSLSVTASLLFGILYYYSTFLNPLSGEDIFAWRMLLTIPFIIIFVAATGENQSIKIILKRIRQQPWLILVLFLSSFLLGIQLWLFLWAPTVNKALEVSLGYFMLPLTLVITGRVIYQDKLTRLQLIATAVASIGVAHELMRIGGFSLTTLTVAFGYPIYFVLRKHFKLNHIGGLWFDLVLMLPASAILAFNGSVTISFLENFPKFFYLLPILGLLSAGALITYILSTKYLSIGLFGLLGYVEPVLLLVVALAIGETITQSEIFTYGPIWLSVCILIFEGSQFLFSTKRNTQRERGANS